MATSPAIKIGKKQQDSLLSFARKILEYHVTNSKELHDKMDVIDRAYARYKESEDSSRFPNGVDARAGSVSCDVFDSSDRVTPPIVVSQVDSYVGYLADVFLSGSPLFPVVSSPATRKTAEQLEVLMDDHAMIGGYARQLLMFFRDACKYNYGAVEVYWDQISQFSSVADYTNGGDRKLSKSEKFYNSVKRLDPRNVILDPSVLPGDVSQHGDFAGYIEEISMTRLKRELIMLAGQEKAFNIKAALETGRVNTVAESGVSFTPQPVISDYVTSEGYKNRRGVDWDAWVEGTSGTRKNPSYGAKYEKLVLYARIIPSDHGIVAPQPNTPQIWRLVVINNSVLVSAHRIISAYDFLPVLIGQPIEDGFAAQTQSIAEGEIPFQEAAEKLYNIRFSAARRAVSDRALYNSNFIKSSDINSKAAAPKIPVNISPLSPIALSALYHQIPFDMRGTESALQDAAQIVQFSKELHGLNNARTGQFQKGNKSVQEWNDVMGGSDNRLRLPALALEIQVFSPMKSIMVLNIFQYGENAAIVSQKTGDVVNVNIAELRRAALSFRMADGYTPKSKLASTDAITQGLTMIGNSQVLQQAYGPMLPAMFAHLMQLMGVRGLEEYDPNNQPQEPIAPDPMAALQQNLLQPPGAPIDPAMADPAMVEQMAMMQQQQLPPGSLP